MNKVAPETIRGNEPKKPQSFIGQCFREFFFLLYIALTWTCIGLIGYFLGSSITILSDLKNSSSNSLSEDILNVWRNNRFITDLTLTSSDNCPSDYFLAYDLKTLEIPNLCTCPKTSLNNGKEILYVSYEGNCTEAQLNKSCIYTDSIPSKNINSWRDGKKFCVKYGSDTFFSKPPTCDELSDYKKCGEGETQICMKTSQSCPITNMIITPLSYINSKYSSIPIDFSNNIYYTYKPQNIPIAYFKVSNSFFCALSYKQFFPNQVSFIHEKDLEAKECEFIDEEFQIVDEMGQLDFFTINNLTSQLISIPSYPKPTN